MTQITYFSLATGLMGLVLAMTGPLVAALPTAVIAVGYVMMFAGMLVSVVGAVVSHGVARSANR
ncbi:hypothetical protein [Ruegeria marisrubri]|uniref:hypothetical protein n=1 Tax=Ruegeria marisrubri TaxID=1685379 RepID=UPI000B0B6905|nr:hypothetical protein [Ruegeria marisrubri]